MSIAVESALRAWINAQPILADEDFPAWRGAYLREQASPADGAYAVIARNPEGVTSVVAEDSAITTARIQAVVYAGTEDAAERAAAALRTAFESLTGCPQPCGDTGVTVLVADNHYGPMFQPVPPAGSEIYSFQVGADFLLMEAS